MARKDIIQELNELGSSLAGTPSQNVYSVPDGYFEAFASSVLCRVAGDAWSFLSQLPKSNPYKVPIDYFDGLADRVLNAVRHHPDYLSSRQELETLSPLLNSLKKEPVFSVPAGYFEKFRIDSNQYSAAAARKPAKVVGIFSRNIMRIAIAAIITGVIGVSGWMVYKNNHRTPEEKIIAGLKKDVKKIDDVKQLENLAEFMDAGLNEKEVASHTPAKTADVEKLLKDVSIDELKEFSEESKDIQDVMMTN